MKVYNKHKLKYISQIFKHVSIYTYEKNHYIFYVLLTLLTSGEDL